MREEETKDTKKNERRSKRLLRMFGKDISKSKRVIIYKKARDCIHPSLLLLHMGFTEQGQ